MERFRQRNRKPPYDRIGVIPKHYDYHFKYCTSANEVTPAHLYYDRGWISARSRDYMHAGRRVGGYVHVCL
jgi:hypothetical protein